MNLIFKSQTTGTSGCDMKEGCDMEENCESILEIQSSILGNPSLTRVFNIGLDKNKAGGKILQF